MLTPSKVPLSVLDRLRRNTRFTPPKKHFSSVSLTPPVTTDWDHIPTVPLDNLGQGPVCIWPDTGRPMLSALRTVPTYYFGYILYIPHLFYYTQVIAAST